MFELSTTNQLNEKNEMLICEYVFLKYNVIIIYNLHINLIMIESYY